MNSATEVPVAVDTALSRVFLPTWLKWTILACAAAVFALGVAAMFFTTKETGAVTLVAAGIALLVLVVFGERVSSIEALGVKIQVAGYELNKAADQAELDGRPAEAAQLRHSARQLLASSDPIAGSYEFIRANQRPSWERTLGMEELVRQARGLAADAGGPDEVDELFETGEPGRRISALAMMQERPELCHVNTLVEAIRNPRSNFEQYHALRAAESLLRSNVQSSDRRNLVLLLERELDAGSFGDAGSDRNRLASHILKRSDPAD